MINGSIGIISDYCTSEFTSNKLNRSSFWNRMKWNRNITKLPFCLTAQCLQYFYAHLKRLFPLYLHKFIFCFSFSEYFRITINFTSTRYVAILSDRNSAEFRNLAGRVKRSVDGLYDTAVPGKQAATVVQFRLGKYWKVPNSATIRFTRFLWKYQFLLPPLLVPLQLRLFFIFELSSF